MNRLICLFIINLFLTISSYGQTQRTFLIDLGNPDNPTAGNWNNVSFWQIAGNSIDGLIDTMGVSSNINFEIIAEADIGFGDGRGFNTNGYPDGTLGYPATATSDSYFAWNGSTPGEYKLTGLNPEATYTLRLFPSRMASSGYRRSVYNINGIEKVVDGLNNSTETALFENLEPQEGSLTITFSAGSGSSYGYINVLEIIEQVTQQEEIIVATPSQLQLSVNTSNDITLTWQDNSNNETGFEIHRSLDTLSSYSVIDTAAADAVSFIDIGLNPSTTYFYKIRAVANDKSSDFTSIVSGTTTPEIMSSNSRKFLIDLGDPNNPTAGNWNNVSFWQIAGNNIDGLIDTMGVSSNINFEIIAEADIGFGDGRGFNTNGYPDGTLGYPATATSDSYFAWNGSTPGEYKLTGLNPEATYTLRLFPSRMASSGYRRSVYNINGIEKVVDGLNNSTETALFENLEPQEGSLTITFSAGSGSSYGYINVLEIIEQVTQQEEIIVATPSQLQLSVNTSNDITLTWQDNSNNETGFEIHRSSDSLSGFTLINTTTTNITSYTDYSLNSSTQYFYKVRALNEYGHSQFTNIQGFYIPDQGQVPDSLELQALKDMYNSLHANEWYLFNEGWSKIPSLTNLYEIIGDYNGIDFYNGDIEGFSLDYVGAYGNLPQTIENLKELKYIFFSANSLSGTITEGLFNLPYLELLDLSYNQLNGEIPVSIGNQPSLKIVRLNYNELSGNLPEEIMNLYYLEELNISGNMINYIPNFSLHYSASTLFLDVSNNHLSFRHLDPNAFGSINMNYTGQYYAEDTVFVNISEGGSKNLTINKDGMNTTYQWQIYEDGSWNNIEFANDTVFIVEEPLSGSIIRCTLNNPLLPELTLYSSKYKIQVVNNQLYAIKSGDWSDPSVWSRSNNGSTSNEVPGRNEIVYLNGLQITVTNEQECGGIVIQNNSTPSTLSVINGTLKVFGNIKLDRSGLNYNNCKLEVKENGRLETYQ